MERGPAYMQVEGEQLRWLRWGLAGNPALPVAVIDQLIASGDDMVRLELAERDDLGHDQVRALARTGDVGVIARLMRRGLLMPHDAERFDPQLVIAMADIGPVRHDWLHQVAADPDPAVRAALAATAHLPDDIISALADDPDLDVVAEAAASPGLPAPVAERLASHPHVSVRRAIASNECVPVHVLVAIAQRRPSAVERCPGCDPAGHWPTELWSGDGTHRDAMDDLDYALTVNTNTPTEVLNRLASHRSMHVRWSLAYLPATCL